MNILEEKFRTSRNITRLEPQQLVLDVIPASFAGLEVNLEASHRTGLEYQPKTLLTVPKIFFSLPETVNIEIDPSPTGDFSLLIFYRHPTCQYMMPSAIDASEPMLNIPLSARADTLLPRRECSISIVRMQHVTPTKIGALLLSEANHLEETLAGVGITPIGRTDPHAVVNGFTN